MSFLANALGDALLGIINARRHVHLSDADPRSFNDLGINGNAAQRARFNSFRFGEPGASNAARLGVNGR